MPALQGRCKCPTEPREACPYSPVESEAEALAQGHPACRGCEAQCPRCPEGSGFTLQTALPHGPFSWPSSLGGGSEGQGPACCANPSPERSRPCRQRCPVWRAAEPLPQPCPVLLHMLSGPCCCQLPPSGDAVGTSAPQQGCRLTPSLPPCVHPSPALSSLLCGCCFLIGAQSLSQA